MMMRGVERAEETYVHTRTSTGTSLMRGVLVMG